jgi:hypothetical protein
MTIWKMGRATLVNRRDAFQKLIPTWPGYRPTFQQITITKTDTKRQTGETEACNHDETTVKKQNPSRSGGYKQRLGMRCGVAPCYIQGGHRKNKRHQEPWILPKTSAQSAKACRQRTSPDCARTLATWVSLVWKMLTDGESTRLWDRRL